jgi:hypothetical protein
MGLNVSRLRRLGTGIVVLVTGLSAGLYLFLNSFAILSSLASAPYVWFGPHREFFAACRAIPIGGSLARARDMMSPYLEVGRTWRPPASSMAPQAFSAHVLGVPETPEEHSNRILFIPDEQAQADWCLVYSSDDHVARKEISPD